MAAVLVLLLCCSAFFSASETAFSSLNKIKMKMLAAQGKKRAALVLKLTEDYDKLLSTVLIGNNIVNISSSTLAAVLFVGWIGSGGVSLATLVMTILVLIVGEISPKTLAKEAPESFAMFAAPALRLLILIFTPLNYFLSAWKRFIMRCFHVKSDRAVTEAELLTFVEEVRQEGGINRREEEMIRKTIEFDDLKARDIYTPRIDVAAAALTDPLAAIEAKFRETEFSRLPIYDGTIDDIKGILLLKDFYRMPRQPIESLIKPAIFINDGMKIAKLLRILQEKQAHMAVLVDEFGGVRGIITVEDILEELVGEIWDEHDKVVEQIRQIEEGKWKVLGGASMDDLCASIPIPSEAEKLGMQSNARTTVGSWFMENLDCPPKIGVSIKRGELTVSVSKLKRHRVLELIVSLK
jgi:CBS domain containing-hemolysin-like protein